MVWLTLLLVSSAAVAQNLSMFKMLSDSVYLTDAKYRALNKYQKDALIIEIACEPCIIKYKVVMKIIGSMGG